MNKRRENQITHKFKKYNNEIEATKSVKLLSIKIDNKLSFNHYILKLCSKAAIQLIQYEDWQNSWETRKKWQ